MSGPNQKPTKNNHTTDPYTTRKIRVVCGPETSNTSQKPTNKQMASSGANFTAAINALVAERDRVFLLRVAADYGLKYEELHAKYLETAEVAIKVPRKYTKKPKAVVTTEVPTEGAAEPKVKVPKAKAEKQCCTAQTSKKEPCKFSALKGEVFCKRHLKQSLEVEVEPKAKVPKVPKKAAAKPVAPVHTHDLEAGVVEECDLCQSHGNALAETVDFELATPHTGPIKPVSVESRLAALLNEADESDAESEEETAGAYHEEADDGLEEEDFEEEDD